MLAINNYILDIFVRVKVKAAPACVKLYFFRYE